MASFQDPDASKAYSFPRTVALVQDRDERQAPMSVVLTEDEIKDVIVTLRNSRLLLPISKAKQVAIAKFEAILEHPKGITEWRAFVGDEGESNDYADIRETLEEAVADLAILTDQAAEDGEPYNRQGIESRQCGPWVEAALLPGNDNE